MTIAGDNYFGLEDKVVVAWGGTGTLIGIIAEGMALHGAKIILLGRDEVKGRERMQRIQEMDCSAELILADVSDCDGITSVRDEIYQRHGRVDVLINGAGGNKSFATVDGEKIKTFCDIEPDDWQEVFDLNYTWSIVNTSRIFGEKMIAQDGNSNIINVTSASAVLPLSKVVAYSAAKAAALNTTRYLAHEWAQYSIRVNALSPGFFPAKQNMSLIYIGGDPEKGLTERGQQIHDHTPMYRVGEPKELVGPSLLLASDHVNSFMTGEEMRVDGGFTQITI